MEHFNRLELAHTPTPLQRLERAGRHLKIDLWVKRDDLTGDLLTGGNKIRKLEYILSDALEKRADHILVAGGIQSNLAKTTAALSVKLGIKPVMILAGEKPRQKEGNFFLSSFLDIETVFIDASHPSQLERAMHDHAAVLERSGKRPYIVDFGASNGLGALGYLEAYRELEAQKKQKGVEFDREFAAAGSAGTLAGIIAGRSLCGSSSHIAGISPWLPEAEVTERVSKCTGELAGMLNENIDTGIEAGETIIDDNFIGEGYGSPTPGCLEAIRLLAEKEALLLDHTYTGKAMAGLISYVEKGIVKPGEKVLFWHTGGAPALFMLKED